jgi:uncharacterized protein (DUF302 family)
MRNILLAAIIAVFPCFNAQAGNFSIPIDQTVVKKALADGVSMDDAVESMKLRANLLNVKLVAEMPLSKQVEAMGETSHRIEIYQFCDPLVAMHMVEADINFAAYLPCRIAVVEDDKGQGWLIMMNPDMLLNSAALTGELMEQAVHVRNNLLEIMEAGANGDL